MVEFCIDWVDSGRELRSVAAWPSDVSPKSLSSHTNTHRHSHCSVSGLQWAPARLWAPPAALWLAPINHQYHRWELQDTDQRQLTAALRRRVLIMNLADEEPGENTRDQICSVDMCSLSNPPQCRWGRLSSPVNARWVICEAVTHTCSARCASSKRTSNELQSAVQRLP